LWQFTLMTSASPHREHLSCFSIRTVAYVLLCFGLISYYFLLSKLSITLSAGHLLSDAQFYVLSGEQLAGKNLADRLMLPIDAKPFGEQFLLFFFATIAKNFGFGFEVFSLWLSRFLHLGFVISVFHFCLACKLSSRASIFVALVSILEVHILGGTTFGIRGFGFLPRDLGQIISILTLSIYVRQRLDTRTKFSPTFSLLFLAGLFLYPLSVIHLCLLLIIVEIPKFSFLRSAFEKPYAYFNVGIASLCLFVVWVILDDRSILQAPTLDLIKFRNSFMMFDPERMESWLYIRRFLTELGLFIAILVIVKKTKFKLNELVIKIFFIGSLISIIALFIEAHTTFLSLFLSRLSFFSHAAFMVILISFLGQLLRISNLAQKLLIFAFSSVFFLLHLNLSTIYRWADAEKLNNANLMFLKKKVCPIVRNDFPNNRKVLIFSNSNKDLANTIRYACRIPVYVTYKDGGITLSDGVRGKEWRGKWEKTSGSVSNNLMALDTELKMGLFSHVIFERQAKICPLLHHLQLQNIGVNNRYCIYSYSI
jgi:hypothetical protein